MRVCVRVCALVHAFERVYVCVCMRVYAYARLFVCMCACMVYMCVVCV